MGAARSRSDSTRRPAAVSGRPGRPVVRADRRARFAAGPAVLSERPRTRRRSAARVLSICHTHGFTGVTDVHSPLDACRSTVGVREISRRVTLGFLGRPPGLRRTEGGSVRAVCSLMRTPVHPGVVGRRPKAAAPTGRPSAALPGFRGLRGGESAPAPRDRERVVPGPGRTGGKWSGQSRAANCGKWARNSRVVTGSRKRTRPNHPLPPGPRALSGGEPDGNRAPPPARSELPTRVVCSMMLGAEPTSGKPSTRRTQKPYNIQENPLTKVFSCCTR